MPRRKKVVLAPTKFHREAEATLPDGKTIERGDMLKVVGEHGLRFKFDSLVTNIETGAQWIDCFEVYKMRTGVLRAFKSDRIKPVPKRRRRRSANRTADSGTS
jgi:hypothetical protein